MSVPRPRTPAILGRLLVEEGALTAEALESALVEQRESKRRLGEILVARGLVGPEAVARSRRSSGSPMCLRRSPPTPRRAYWCTPPSPASGGCSRSPSRRGASASPWPIRSTWALSTTCASRPAAASNRWWRAAPRSTARSHRRTGSPSPRWRARCPCVRRSPRAATGRTSRWRRRVARRRSCGWSITCWNARSRSERHPHRGARGGRARALPRGWGALRGARAPSRSPARRALAHQGDGRDGHLRAAAPAGRGDPAGARWALAHTARLHPAGRERGEGGREGAGSA